MKLINIKASKSLIIGDVHSSPDKLNQLLDMTSHLDIEKYIFLGDLVDRGPDPEQAIAIVHKLVTSGKAHVLVGNHDWKFIRKFAGNNKVSIKAEQEETLRKMKDRSIEQFKEIFGEDLVVGAWDADLKLMFGHAASGRPLSVFSRATATVNDLMPELDADQVSINDTIGNSAIQVSNKSGNKFLYGMVNGQQKDENGFPERLPITTSADDDLEGWKFIHGHTHAKTFHPENGNPNIICLDWACGEEDGQLAGLYITDRDSVNESNLFLTSD